jgi:rhamnopyranosyl-N-acetylglucosaminyl-diphospho-decaprenol beta-1,3/1,4-galactofuranosyltransferase
MKIAAVVVTYNRKNLLGECLDAILRQTRAPEAVYVIDNASTDGTCEFLKEKYCLEEKNEIAGEASSKISAENGSVEIKYIKMNINQGA